MPAQPVGMSPSDLIISSQKQPLAGISFYSGCGTPKVILRAHAGGEGGGGREKVWDGWEGRERRIGVGEQEQDQGRGGHLKSRV